MHVFQHVMEKEPLENSLYNFTVAHTTHDGGGLAYSISVNNDVIAKNARSSLLFVQDETRLYFGFPKNRIF
jgi:hypothetical protein